MKSSLLTMVTSKKAIAAVMAILIYLVGSLFGADKETIDHIYQGILVYVGAQGVADAGKSAARIKAVAGVTGSAGIDVPAAASAMSRVASQVGILIVVVCAVGVALQAGCSKEAAGRVTSIAVTTGLNCESAHFDERVFSDARVFADAKVAQWLAGAGKPSSEQIGADLAPFRSDLVRCAIAGAVAAAISLGTAPQPPAGASSLAASSRVAGGLRESFGDAKNKLGWGEIRLTNGTVI